MGARRWHGLGRGEGEHATVFASFLGGDLGLCSVRVSGRDGDRPSWKIEPETGGGDTRLRSGGLVKSGAVFTGPGTLAYLSSGDSSSTCLSVCPQD